MAEPSLQLGNGNWAGKSDNLLAYHKANNNFYADELTFARASTGTIVNADGLIEQVPYNLLSYSNDFSQWVASNLTITADNVTSPDGTLNASKIEMTGNGSIRSANELTFNNAYTYSIFVKKGNSRYVTLRSAFFTTNAVVGFDLDTLTAQTDGTIEDYGNDWYRLSISKDISVDADKSGFFYLYLPNSLGSQTSVSGNYNYFYGGQIEDRDTAKTYFPTTTRLNVPRVDYLNNANGSLKLEPQRSNLITYSSDFSNASWTEGGVTIAANDTTSPDGTTNADKFLETAVNGIHVINNTSPITASATSTASVFYKKGTRRYFSLKIQIGSNSYTQVFDSEGLTTGSNSSNGLTNVSTKIEDYGNGWVRASVAGTSASGTSAYVIIGLSNSLNPTFHPTNYNPTYQGSVTDYGYFYGAQVESNSSYATSYIPTSGTTVTRVADSCSQTGLSNVIGQTEGTMFVEFVWNGVSSVVADSSIFSLGNQEYGNSSIAISNYNGTLYSRITNGTSVDASVNYGSMTLGTRYKCAIGYANNDFVFYVNGAQIGSDTSVSIPTRSDVYLQNAHPNSKSVNQAILYNTRLLNSELATLTTI